MAIEAICADCGKTWKVPDASRIYKCKQCGGKVAVAEEAPAAAPEPAPAPTTAEVRRAKTVQHSTIAPLPPETKPPTKRAAGGAGRKKILIVGGAVVVSVGVLIGIIIASQGPSLEERAESFEQAWASGSMDNLDRWFTHASVKVAWDELKGKFKFRGWMETRPRLQDRSITDETGNSASVDYSLNGKAFQTRWVRDGAAWKIKEIQSAEYVGSKDPRAKKVERSLPSFTGKFRSAWNDQQYKAIADLLSTTEPPAWKDRLGSLGEKYQDRVLEEIPEVRWISRIKAFATFNSPNGPVTTSWTYENGWLLTGLNFKK